MDPISALAALPADADPESVNYLLAHIKIGIGRVDFHVEAVRVVLNDDGEQEPAPGPDYESNVTRLDDLYTLTTTTDWRTVTIPNRKGEWVLWITPYEV